MNIRVDPDHALPLSVIENNPWLPFFGPPPSNKNFDPTDLVAREAFNLPDAYMGKNLFLASTIDAMITEDIHWVTDKILPFLHSDQLNLVWHVLTLDRTLLDPEAEQSVPRFLTIQKTKHEGRVIRSGIGFLVEHGFWKTPEGIQNFALNLRVLRHRNRSRRSRPRTHSLQKHVPLQHGRFQSKGSDT